MIRRLSQSLVLAGTAAFAVLALAAAHRPAALSNVSGGLWEISMSAAGRNATKVCLADPLALAQYEHRTASCTRKVISDKPSEAVIHYDCPGGGFGDTKMTVLTPRSMRVETQGISDNAPFNYVLQVRRVGDCPAR
ncbi:MAG TPA: DUF3617 family protein [Sphingomicrobium sp.]|nr:DUF3617 family protein [Sphingomicrobium sp.]